MSSRSTAASFNISALKSAPPIRTPLRDFAVDALVAAIMIACTAGARIAIEQVVGGVAPFILSFPAVMAATLLRGATAGTITAFGCQLLSIRYVFPHWVSDHGGVTTDLANVVLSTVALAGVVWATASYRRASVLLRAQCDRQIGTMSLLIAEMDHRTKNNFQIAASLLAHQAVMSMDGELARELDTAASRLETIAAVHRGLAFDPAARTEIDLADHLNRIVKQLRSGATPGHIILVAHTETAVVPAQTAMIAGLIVNEWVSNALKYAFGEETGRIDVELARTGEQTRIRVKDDGKGYAVDAGGSGSELVRSLADVIGATVDVQVERGTICTLRFTG